MKNYLINLDSEIEKRKDYNIPIYRIMPFKRIVEMLKNGEVILTQTKLWDDVYENFLLKSSKYFDDIKINLSEHIDTLYGQCWSLNRETDAMWRIYSTDKLGVKIKTTIAKLTNSALHPDNQDKFHTFSIRIGKVKYDYLKNIKKKYSNFTIVDLISFFEPMLIESQFIKRKEFNHEREVRIIIRKTIPENKIAPKIIKLKIDPNEFIENIIFDPRLDYSDYKIYKEILEKYGFKNNIYKSKLYNFEGLTL